MDHSAGGVNPVPFHPVIRRRDDLSKEDAMLRGVLWTIAAILVIAWVIALAVKVTFAAIHLLLVAAVILVIGSFVLGRGVV
jgi:hypothetical protein